MLRFGITDDDQEPLKTRLAIAVGVAFLHLPVVMVLLGILWVFAVGLYYDFFGGAP